MGSFNKAEISDLLDNFYWMKNKEVRFLQIIK